MDASATGHTPQEALLLRLSSSGREDAPNMVARLLKMGVAADTANAEGFTALASAARVGALFVCKELLAHGASPTAPTHENRNPPLFWAAGKGHVEVVRLLCNASASVVHRLVALATTDCHAPRLKVCGHKSGKGHTPETLPTASASITTR